MPIVPLLVGAVLAPLALALARRLMRSRRAAPAPVPVVPVAPVAAAAPAVEPPPGPPPEPSSRRRGDVFVAILAALLVAFGVFGAQRLLAVKAPDSSELPGVAVVSPVEPEAQVGFALSMGIDFNGCDEPVDVALVAMGTSEFWVKNATRVPREATFRLVLPAGLRGGVRAWMTTDGTEGYLRPLKPLVPGAQPLAVRTRRLHLGREVRAGIANWGESLRPVVVHFKADWLDSRGWGTCYLRVPAITGAMSILNAQDALGRATTGQLETGGEIVVSETGLKAEVDEVLEPVRGLVSVATGKHRLARESTQPEPDVEIHGLPTWSCAQRDRAREDVLPEPREVPDVLSTIDPDSAAVLSAKRIDRVIGAGDCSAVVVLEEADAPRRRDIALLVVGAAFSMGLSLLLEMAVRRMRGRRGGAD